MPRSGGQSEAKAPVFSPKAIQEVVQLIECLDPNQHGVVTFADFCRGVQSTLQIKGANFEEAAFRCQQFTCRNCGGGDRGRVAIYRPFGEVSLSLNRTVTCMVLKANDRRTSCPCHDEFRGPRSDYVRQVALATTTTT
ncbi:uncharacterized protein TNCV_3176491 [Trichonephila clavipes]|nr:uncharacterized protein TNCV_3176491 [Trichonephila clavipes]